MTRKQARQRIFALMRRSIIQGIEDILDMFMYGHALTNML